MMIEFNDYDRAMLSAIVDNTHVFESSNLDERLASMTNEAKRVALAILGRDTDPEYLAIARAFKTMYGE